MNKFKSQEWFKIRGRGWVCSINLEEDVYAKDMYLKEVIIDDKEYFVIGIESFTKNRLVDPGKGYLFGKGESIGLLIRGEK